MLVCATLYNFLRKECHFDEFSIKAVDEPSSSMLPVNENYTFEPIIQTHEQERKDANAWRTSIAMNIYVGECF
uniref:Uncharacterized protein n=1 Tax=Cajanus cajan TaxID=3821 RepID=A0A151SZL8_CAJCA|nr:hypothetical protein KK1_015697 [Cajanus cajan]